MCRRRGTWLAVAVVLVMQLGLHPPQVVAAGGASGMGPVLEGPDVIRYASDARFVDPVRVLYQGTRLAGGGCRFKLGELTLPAGWGFVEIEVAYRESTCQSLTERELFRAGVDSRFAPRFTKPPTGALSRVKAVGSEGEVSAQTHEDHRFDNSHFAYLHSWWQDPKPFSIHVNEITTWISWTPDGTCTITPGTTAWLGSHPELFETTKWEVEGGEWITGYGCPTLSSTTYISFVNRTFCVNARPYIPLPIQDPLPPEINPTRTRYFPNAISAFPNGRSSIVPPAPEKSGGCARFLSFGTEFYPPPA